MYDVLGMGGPVGLSQVVGEGWHLTGVFVLLFLLLLLISLLEQCRGNKCVAGKSSNASPKRN